MFEGGRHRDGLTWLSIIVQCVCVCVAPETASSAVPPHTKPCSDIHLLRNRSTKPNERNGMG
jgi:hypothetical protein